MGNGSFAYGWLIRSLKGNRPDQVISVLKIVAAYRGAFAAWEHTSAAPLPMQGRKALWPDPNNYIINRNQGGQEKKRSRQPYSQKSACVGYLPRRRCPIRIPRCRAFCRRAPAVRFIDFEMAFTGVLLFECLLSSLSSCLVQTRRTTRFAVLAISSSPSKFIGLCKFLQAPQS